MRSMDIIDHELMRSMCGTSANGRDGLKKCIAQTRGHFTDPEAVDS